MTYNEARKNATTKYKAANYKRIPLDVPITFYDLIKESATAAGESVNGYIKQSITYRMNTEGRDAEDIPPEVIANSIKWLREHGHSDAEINDFMLNWATPIIETE